MSHQQPLGLTELVLRDAHQSLLATRLRIEDMLPIASALDDIGYWSLETWGGATFDACIRFLGEDPWERLRALKAAMPKTRQQMLLRGQNILGYRHYADDVVDAFVARAAANGMDVFRVFDAMNDVRNMERAVRAVQEEGKHAQACLSYTLSPVHHLDTWLEMADKLQAMGAHSIAIKDMAGLLKPYTAFELVSALKSRLDIPVHMQCHATTGLSTATALKAVEAGIDNIDTAISSMSMTYGHSPTETMVAILEDQPRSTGLDLMALAQVADYFRDVRKKYSEFEGSLRGVDARILTAQVPGGMLTNMENQLKAQGALDRFTEVLDEIPRVRKDLGYIPLVTPTSQIVGTQAVLNVLAAQRYAQLSKETAGVLKGEYGAAPAPFNIDLQQRVLEGKEPITCRPADLLPSEMEALEATLVSRIKDENLHLGELKEDVLTFALFDHVAIEFFKNRHNPAAFEPIPGALAQKVESTVSAESKAIDSSSPKETGRYQVMVDGECFQVVVSPDTGEAVVNDMPNQTATTVPKVTSAAVTPLKAPLTGTLLRFLVNEGDDVVSGQAVALLEAMKMETQVVAHTDGQISTLCVVAGSSVQVGDILLQIK